MAVEPPTAGGLSLRQPGLDISPPYRLDPESAPVLSLSSELTRANKILEGLYFKPSTDFFGAVVVTFDVNDGGASGKGGVLSASSSMPLEVKPVNDPPKVTVPRAHRRLGGRGPLPILGVEIDDVDIMDGEAVSVFIVAEKGSIFVDPSPDVLISNVPGEDSANDTDDVTVVGLLPDVINALSHVWFVLPSEGWEGGSTVTFSATDSQGAMESTDCLVVVSDPDISPIITAVNVSFIADQGTKTPVPGLSITDFVAESAVLDGKPSPVFHVSVATEAGGVGLFPVPPGVSIVPGSETARTASAAITAGEGLQGVFGKTRSTVSFGGTLPTVNAALEAVVYMSANGSKGLGTKSVTVEVTRQGRADNLSARHQILVDVQPVNQPPSIHWNATESTVESPEVGGFSLRGLGFSDSDLADEGILSVRLEVLDDEDNIVVRSNGAGLEFFRGAADGVPSSTIAFRGNATSVAAAVSASAIVLNYPGASRALVPALRVTVEDGDGGETSQVVEVYGSHVNSPPEVIIENPLQKTLKEGGVLERVGELAGIEIHDADVEDSSKGILEVNISVSHRAVLEIQNITTSATKTHPVQTITTRSSSGNGNSTIGGMYNLTLDLTSFCENCGVEETGPIWHDAVGMEDDVRVGLGSGSETGESIQAKLEALPGLQALGVSVHCQRRNILSSEGGREWLVTFLGAPASLPMMQVTGDSLTGDTPYVEVTYPVKGNSLSGSFTLSLGGYQTEPIPYNAEAADVAAALEALPSITAVDATMPDPPNPQGGRHWTVTFFEALGAGGDIPLMEVDGQALGGHEAAVQITEAVRGNGIAEVWGVETSAAHRNLVSVVTLSGALKAKGHFKLGLDYGGRLAWTRPIYPRAVGPASEEDGRSWSFGGVPGRKRGESVEGRLLSLDNWGELGSAAGVTVKRVESANGNVVNWSITFAGAPEDLESPSIDSTQLTGGGVVSVALTEGHNQVQGFFHLAYGNVITTPLAHDSSGEAIATALNSLDSLHSSDVGTGLVAASRTQATTLEGGRRWLVAFLSEPEIPANLTATGTLTTGLSGDSARVRAALVRRGGRGAILRLVDLGGAAFGLPGYTTGERLTVRGRPETVTSALSSLSYSPRAGWNGGVDILLRAHDGGFTGDGGPQSGWGMVSTSVEEVNNPVELLWCGSVLGLGGARVDGVDEDAPFRLMDYDCGGGGTPVMPTLFDHTDLGGPGPGLAVHDPDGGSSITKVRKQVWHCNV